MLGNTVIKIKGVAYAKVDYRLYKVCRKKTSRF